MEEVIDLQQTIQKDGVNFGIISDTHGSLNENIIGSLQQCDVILHAGDIGDADVLDDLKKFTPHVFPVRGNNDVEPKWPQQHHRVLKKIPETIELRFNNQVIAMTHGHQHACVDTRHTKLRKQFEHASIIVYGHSHRLVCDCEQTPWVINPGAGGYNRTFGGPSCLVIHYHQKKWSIKEYRAE